MKRIIAVLTLLFFLAGCAAIKPNTMTDEQLNEVANADCQKGAISLAILGVFFVGIGAIPLYLAASHQCPKNKELARKALEDRKLASTRKEEIHSEDLQEAVDIDKPMTDVALQSQAAPEAKTSVTQSETPALSTPVDIVSKSQAPQRKESSDFKQTSPAPSTEAQSIRQKELKAPVWIIGDTWKFQGEDKKSWDAEVIRVEGDLYIVRVSSKSGHLQAYDKNTLNLKCNIDKEGKITKIEDASLFMPTGAFIYFDFPLHLGKKWSRTITLKSMDSISRKPTNHLETFECIAYESIATPLGSFETIRVKITLTNVERMISRVAHVWYSHELKSLIKISFEKMPPWSSEQQGFELISFNFKGNQTFKPEMKSQTQKPDISTNAQSPAPSAAQTSDPQVNLPPQKVSPFQKSDTPSLEKPLAIKPIGRTGEQTSGSQTKSSPQKTDILPQPSLSQKQQVPPPITPSPSAKTPEVDNFSKFQQPPTNKGQVPSPATFSTNADIIAVTGTSANIRAGAGNEFPIVTTVKKGDKLILLGEYGQWLNVRLENGQEGWVNGRFVKE